MGYTHTSAIGCQTITVMSLTLCGSIIALINPVRALTCSAGHLVVIYSEVPCNSPNAGIPHPKSANTMQPGRLRSVFQSVRKYGLQWRVGSHYLLSISIILVLRFPRTFIPHALLCSIQFILYYFTSKAQILHS